MTGRRFLFLFVTSALGLAAAVALALLVLDPFDRGHGLIASRGTLEGGPRTATVSRGRDPAFNAAVIGNSHVQLLKPERLDAATGLKWVQLTVPATLAQEQMVVMHWFLRHHRQSAAALVIGTDYNWCHADPEVRSKHPFPYWLYDADPLTYYPRLFRMQAARILPRKVALVAGRARPRAADGYWDYETYRTRNEAQLLKDAEAVRTHALWNETGRFPWIDRLTQELAAIPAGVSVVLVAPPHFQGTMPLAGTAQAQAERACAARLADVARKRARTAFVDLRSETSRLGDIRYFWDTTHYTSDVAREIETRIGAALTTIGPVTR